MHHFVDSQVWVLASAVALPVLLDATVKGSLVLVLAGAAAFILRNRSAATRHLVWCSAMVGLILLPTASLTLPGWRVLPDWLDARRVLTVHAPREAEADGSPTSLPAADSDDQPPVVVLSRKQSPDITVLRPVPEPANTLLAGDFPSDRTNSKHTAWAWLVPVWAAGTFLLLLRLLLGQLSLWRLSRRANPIEAGPLADALKRLRLESGMQRNIVLLGSGERSVPMTWGIWRPKLLLPDEAFNWPADRCRAVLLHELAHIRRWDCLTHWIAQVACVVYWFHPLVWAAARQLKIEREKTCDDLVLNSGVPASQYAEHLLHVVAHCDGNLPVVSSCAVCMAQSTKLEGRLRAILAEGRSRWTPTRKVVALTVTVLLSAILPMAMMAAADEEGDTARQQTVIKRQFKRAVEVTRWQADPFVGTKSLEVEHVGGGPGENTYVIDEPEVVASLLRELKITRIVNDMAIGLVPSAWVTFIKQDGDKLRTAFHDDRTLGIRSSEVTIGSGFLAALNRHLGKKTGKAVNLLEFVKAPRTVKVPPLVPASAKSLTAGFTSFEVSYVMVNKKRSLRRARFTDPKVLAELQGALKIIKQEPIQGDKPRSQHFVAVSKDSSRFYGQFLNDKQFFDFKVGRFTVEPTFVETINAHLSRLEGRPIDLLADNQLTKHQLRREQDFRKLLDNVRVLSFSAKLNGKPQTVTVDDPKKVAELLKALEWIEVPLKERKPERDEFFIELTTRQDTKIRFSYLKTGEGIRPYSADLVEVSGFGQVWLDNQWKYRFLHGVVYEMQRAEEERQQLETIQAVCRDLPAFLTQVITVSVGYRQGEDQNRWGLPANRSKLVLKALAVDKVEQLEWNLQRWKAELTKLEERGAGSLTLTPGVGFDLPLVIAGERQMLIPRYGRITFKSSPIKAIQNAIESDPKTAQTVELLPR